jgi:glycosyltransferase involved in cell wall biosynthesis
MLGRGTRRGPYGAWHRLRRLSRLVNSTRAQIVHSFCRRSEVYAILATKLARRGKVLGVRRNIGYWQNWRSRWASRFVAALGAEYAANCRAAREFAAKVEWIPQRRVCVIPNPVPSRRLKEGLSQTAQPESLGILKGEQVVGIVASVRPIKDYATFLAAASLVLKIHPRTRFLIVGPHQIDYQAKMEQLARNLAIERQISWVGPVPNPISVVRLFDVAVLSSLSEAMSNAVQEYMAVGIPTVATDVGGMREIIDDGATGFIVPARAPAALAERINRLLSDAALRSAIGRRARAKAHADFVEQRVLHQYCLLYSRLAGMRRRQ